MRKIFALSLLAVAVAAPAAVLGAEPYAPVAVAAPAGDWTGFYAGVHGGYALDRDGSSSFGIGPATLDLGGALIEGTLATEQGRIEALFGGVNAGYMYQHDALVLGAEVGVSAGGFGRSDSTSFDFSFDDGVDVTTGTYDETIDYDLNWVSTFQGRIGIAFGDSQIFVKAGVALADAAYRGESDLDVDAPGIPLVLDLPGSSGGNELLAGPALNIGFQHMITDSVSIGAEYAYVGLPEMDVTSPGILGGLLGIGGDGTVGNAFHSIRGGVSLHF